MTEQVETTAPLGSMRSIDHRAVVHAPIEDAGFRGLASDEIRARARPRAVVFAWAWHVLCALIVAIPVWAWARRSFGAHPDGDAIVFRPGGWALLSWLDEDGPALAVVIRASLIAIVVFLVVGQIVTGTVVASLATGRGPPGRPAPLSRSLRSGMIAFVPMLVLAVLSGGLEICIFGTGLLLSSSVDEALKTSAGDGRAFSIELAVVGVFALGAAIAGVFADLARVSLARDVAIEPDADVSVSRRLRDAVLTAFRTARATRRAAIFGWGWRAAIGLTLVYAGAVAGDLASARAGPALWLLFAFHLLVLLGRASLRASWFAKALRLVLRR